MYNFNSNYNYNPNPNMNNNWFTINGYDGARNFNVSPNQTILLIDTQAPYMYMKTANQMGQTSIKTYKIVEMPSNPQEMAENERYSIIDERLRKIEEALSITSKNASSNNLMNGGDIANG